MVAMLRHTSGYSALVAEPEGPVRRRLTGRLAELGFRIYEAGRCREMLEIAGRFCVNAMFVDAELPEYGGLEALRMLSSSDEVPPFVLLASRVTSPLMSEALELRAVTILRKGSDMDIVGEFVDEIVERCGRRSAYGWPRGGGSV